MQEKQLFDRIISLACSVFEAYSGVLFLREKEDSYKLVSHFSLGDNIDTKCRVRPGKGLVGWILRKNSPLVINEFDREGDSLGYYRKKREEKIKAFMGCPLDNGQGVLCLDSKRSHTFSTKDQKLLHQFVLLIQQVQTESSSSTIPERERNYYACLQSVRLLRENYQRWSDFLNSYLQCLNQYTGFAYCFFATRNKDGSGYFLEGSNRRMLSQQNKQELCFHIQEGLVGWVFRNNTLVSRAEKENGSLTTRILNKEADPPHVRCVICLPLIIHLRVRGVLVLADTEQQNIPDHLLNFLLLIRDQLALFLENLYLKNRLKRFESSA